MFKYKEYLVNDLKVIFFCSIPIFISYLCMGTYLWEFNPGNWALDDRIGIFTNVLKLFGVLTLLGLLAFCIYMRTPGD